MTLQDAWLNILEMKNCEKYSPSQVFSILSDLGVFKENPRIRLCVKAALYHNLWTYVLKTTVSQLDIALLKSKLEYDGFADNVIETMLNSFYAHPKDSNVFPPNPKIASSFEDGDNNSSDNNIDNKQSKITDKSLSPDISDYMNSILEIDKESFNKHGFILQRFEKIKYTKNGFGIVSGLPGPELSYEIIGSKKENGYLNLYVYDNNGFLRDILSYERISIENQYSIINNVQTRYIALKPSFISKLILRIDSNFPNIIRFPFSHVEAPLKRYDGQITDNLSFGKIISSQILYRPSCTMNNISFYVRFEITEFFKLSYFKEHISAILYDKNGKIRQKCIVSEMRSMCNLCPNIASEILAFSEEGLNSHTLLIPFDEIGKILFLNE